MVMKRPTAEDLARAKRRFDGELAAYLRGRGPTTLADAREKVGLYCNSFTRLATIIKLGRRRLCRADLLTLLGEHWPDCDHNGRIGGELLRIILPETTAPEMMTEAERAALAALPETVTIYRGADRGVNEAGLCWSLDRTIAARFPFYWRYYAKHPVLVTATVARERIVAVKLDRKEAEVITAHAIVSSVVDLEHREDEGGRPPA
jgi:hypothetical protein